MFCGCSKRHEHPSSLEATVVLCHALQVAVEIQIGRFADVLGDVVSGFVVVADFLAVNVGTVSGDL